MLSSIEASQTQVSVNHNVYLQPYIFLGAGKILHCLLEAESRNVTRV